MAYLQLSPALTDVFTKPTSEPLRIFSPEADSRLDVDDWEDARIGFCMAADSLITAGLRLTTPFVVGYGLVQHTRRAGAGCAPLKSIAAAPLGLLAGAAVGGAGIVCNLFYVGVGLSVTAVSAARGGLQALSSEASRRSAKSSQ